MLGRLRLRARRGPGNREEATTTLAELRAIRDPVGTIDRELQAFLLAVDNPTIESGSTNNQKLIGDGVTKFYPLYNMPIDPAQRFDSTNARVRVIIGNDSASIGVISVATKPLYDSLQKLLLRRTPREDSIARVDPSKSAW